MQLLIDGYNLMWASNDLNVIARKNFNLAREMLEKLIIAYSKTVEDEVFLVLDGYRGTCPYTQRVTKEGVEVVITGKGKNADLWMIETMAIKGFRGSIVTSDREIMRSAERRNIEVITSGKFEKRLMNAIGYELALLNELRDLKRKYQPVRKRKKRRFY